jgi:hypothetical protein
MTIFIGTKKLFALLEAGIREDRKGSFSCLDTSKGVSF